MDIEGVRDRLGLGKKSTKKKKKGKSAVLAMGIVLMALIGFCLPAEAFYNATYTPSDMGNVTVDLIGTGMVKVKDKESDLVDYGLLLVLVGILTAVVGAVIGIPVTIVVALKKLKGAFVLFAVFGLTLFALPGTVQDVHASYAPTYTPSDMGNITVDMIGTGMVKVKDKESDLVDYGLLLVLVGILTAVVGAVIGIPVTIVVGLKKLRGHTKGRLYTPLLGAGILAVFGLTLLSLPGVVPEAHASYAPTYTPSDMGNITVDMIGTGMVKVKDKESDLIDYGLLLVLVGILTAVVGAVIGIPMAVVVGLKKLQGHAKGKHHTGG